MRSSLNLALAATLWLVANASAFEGRITAVTTQSGQTQTFLYTVGTHDLRIERTETNWPYARNLVNRESGALVLIFPHNRSFVRPPPPATNAPAPGTPRISAMPLPPGGLPPGIGPQTRPANSPAAMPMMHMERAELKATGEKTNLLGYLCTRYELKQRGEVMEIWATDQLLPYQAWQQNQPHRFGPRLIEEQWPELLKAKKLFPLLAILKFENGPERLRFEVKAITSEKVEDRDGQLFQPPPDYHEIEPLPF